MNSPLSKIRVLDLSRILAAPWAAQMLGDLGAEVIKVERPRVGDDSRRFGPPFLKDAQGRDTTDSAFYISANRNKRSITVDLAKPEGQSLIRELAAKCDVLIENYKVGDLARYGLDYASLRALNPRLVYCSVTGFGQTGPYAARPGYDTVFQAMSGLMSVTGLPDGEPGGGPMKTGPSLADILAGHYSVSAILAALYHRDLHSGEGQHIDVSLLDSTIAAMSHYASHYLVGGELPVRRGTEGNGGMPSRLFRCADEDIVIVAGNNEQYARLCEVLGCPEAVADERFATVALRGRNRKALGAILEPRIAAWKSQELLETLERAGVPAGPVYNLAQVFDDPHVRSRGIVVEAVRPGSASGSVRMVAHPVKFSATPVSRYRAPPSIGQHTREVLGEVLGLGEAEIGRLAAAGAI
jgi:crotonobetainyl-CoA:carnitine CoA-transferase CaiB-like acyl-CoA transferase